MSSFCDPSAVATRLEEMSSVLRQRSAQAHTRAVWGAKIKKHVDKATKRELLRQEAVQSCATDAGGSSCPPLTNRDVLLLKWDPSSTADADPASSSDRNQQQKKTKSTAIMASSDVVSAAAHRESLMLQLQQRSLDGEDSARRSHRDAFWANYRQRNDLIDQHYLAAHGISCASIAAARDAELREAASQVALAAAAKEKRLQLGGRSRMMANSFLPQSFSASDVDADTTPSRRNRGGRSRMATFYMANGRLAAVENEGEDEEEGSSQDNNSDGDREEYCGVSPEQGGDEQPSSTAMQPQRYYYGDYGHLSSSLPSVGNKKKRKEVSFMVANNREVDFQRTNGASTSSASPETIVVSSSSPQPDFSSSCMPNVSGDTAVGTDSMSGGAAAAPPRRLFDVSRMTAKPSTTSAVSTAATAGHDQQHPTAAGETQGELEKVDNDEDDVGKLLVGLPPFPSSLPPPCALSLSPPSDSNSRRRLLAKMSRSTEKPINGLHEPRDEVSVIDGGSRNATATTYTPRTRSLVGGLAPLPDSRHHTMDGSSARKVFPFPASASPFLANRHLLTPPRPSAAGGTDSNGYTDAEGTEHGVSMIAPTSVVDDHCHSSTQVEDDVPQPLFPTAAASEMNPYGAAAPSAGSSRLASSFVSDVKAFLADSQLEAAEAGVTSERSTERTTGEVAGEDDRRGERVVTRHIYDDGDGVAVPSAATATSLAPVNNHHSAGSGNAKNHVRCLQPIFFVGPAPRT